MDSCSSQNSFVRVKNNELHILYRNLVEFALVFFLSPPTPFRWRSSKALQSDKAILDCIICIEEFTYPSAFYKMMKILVASKKGEFRHTVKYDKEQNTKVLLCVSSEIVSHETS